MKNYILIISLLISSNLLIAEERILSDKAPADNPVSIKESEMKKFYRLIEPYVKKAKKTYPQAKARYLKGLPKGEHLFLKTMLYDKEKNIENVFILVKNIEKGMVSGIIYNQIYLVKGYKNGQRYKFSESEVYDWLITKPDGSEEGNYVGKFLDTYQKK